MEVLLEDYVPYDESVAWTISDTYYPRKGLDAWRGGEIPFFATSNYAIARQHAQFAVALAESAFAEDDARFVVLEVGCGLGEFAAAFLSALERGCGAAGRRLARRIQYVLSDRDETNVQKVAASDALRERVAAGCVVPAVMDIARPDSMRVLEGHGAIAGSPAIVIANYLCCATRPRVLRHTAAGWEQRHVRIFADISLGSKAPAVAAREFLARCVADPAAHPLTEARLEQEWRPVDLARLFPAGAHRRALESLAARHAEATIIYPYVFLDFATACARSMHPAGAIIVGDFGTIDPSEIVGTRDVQPRTYGCTLCHGVHFPVLEAYFREAGLGMCMTSDPLRAVHVAAITVAPEVPERLARAFGRAHRGDDGGDLLDFRRLGHQSLREGEYGTAARLFQRCLRLEPARSETYYNLGDAYLRAGLVRPALSVLAKGAKLPGAEEHDFDALLGEAHHRLGRPRRAIRLFERAVARRATADTYASLGAAYQDAGRKRPAYRALKKALELEPENERAKRLMARLAGTWLDSIVERPRATRRKTEGGVVRG